MPGDPAPRRDALAAALAERLADDIPEIEASRRRWLPAVVAALAAPVLVGVAIEALAPGSSAVPFGVLFALLVAWMVAGGIVIQVQGRRAREALLPAVSAVLGGGAWRVGLPWGADGGPGLPLFRPFGFQRLHHRFDGTTDGIPWSASELALTEQLPGLHDRPIGIPAPRNGTRGSRSSPVFAGLVVALRLPVPVASRILCRGVGGGLFAPQRLPVETLPAEGFTRLPPPDPAFARHFDLWAEDPEEARRILTPALAAALAAEASRLRRGRTDAAFLDGTLLLFQARATVLPWIGATFRPASRLPWIGVKVIERLGAAPRLARALAAG
ncbi:MAG: DUF3137 domain-containing protein [Acetobacteraceae bacterium]